MNSRHVRLRKVFLLVSFFLSFCSVVRPAFATPLQYDLITSVNLSQGGSVRPDCSAGCRRDSGAAISLVAVPAQGYVFQNWSGDCASIKPMTVVGMTGPKSCLASFAPCANQPARIGALGYDTFSAAYAHASDNDTIRLLATNVQETFLFNRSVPVLVSGGYDCGFNSNQSESLLQGYIAATAGTTTLENLLVLSGTPPVITSFFPAPSSIASGQNSTLSWRIADAFEASIDKGVGAALLEASMYRGGHCVTV